MITEKIVPAGELLENAVVKPGSLYATLFKQGDPGHVYVIGDNGDKAGNIAVPDATVGFGYPVRTPAGNIFVAGGDGVWKITASSRQVSRIYTLPSTESCDGVVKCDDLGNIYVLSRAKFGAQVSIRSFDQNGAYRWTYSSPVGCSTAYTPAIDTNRRNLYVPYYDAATKTSYLAMVDSDSRTAEYTRSWTSINTSAESACTPTIGSDGTVYVGVYTTVYALDPNNTLNSKWQKDQYPGYARDLTIANNHLYSSYWKQVGGPWTYVVSARGLDDGDVDWEIPLALGSYDDVQGQILAGSNDSIVFTIDKPSSQSYRIYAYQDKGSSAASCWAIDYPYGQAGDLAIGPGNTLYVLGRDRITAISQGSRRAPDGLGMGWTDNLAPYAATNGGGIPDGAKVSQDSVTVSWGAIDPDESLHPGSVLTYDVLVSQGGCEYIVASGISEKSCVVSGLVPGEEYAWRVIASDGQAVTASESWTFTYDPPAFQVSSLTPTPTGCEVRVTRDVNAALVNVYDGQDSAVDAADFTVTGSVVGEVKGSLVWDAPARTLTFVKTGNLRSITPCFGNSIIQRLWNVEVYPVSFQNLPEGEFWLVCQLAT